MAMGIITELSTTGNWKSQLRDSQCDNKQ